jgi:hypothetical protein
MLKARAKTDILGNLFLILELGLESALLLRN